MLKTSSIDAKSMKSSSVWQITQSIFATHHDLAVLEDQMRIRIHDHGDLL
jgi:hypothetical protein